MDILFDSALGHALIWQNDPFWTYWVTKTLLIATVFAIGTAWIGLGTSRGALISLVHTIILTVYYWTFSPVGLPTTVDWLDVHHTWTTGVPIHFLVIYLGYLSALWLWRSTRLDTPLISARHGIRSALITTLISIVVLGILSSLALGTFVGVTWFITRILVVFPFLFFFLAYIPSTRAFRIGYAFVMSLILTNYSHYLSPLGLPGTWRLFDTTPPVTIARWLTYRELWVYQFPIYFIVMLVTIWMLRRRGEI